MPIGYTVRDITTSSITVDYDNGSWATIPIEATLDKSLILDRIRQFSGTQSGFTSTEQIPFEVGETGTVLTISEAHEAQTLAEQQRPYSYAQVRQAFYPTVGDQLDALYWTRNGDTARQAAIDQQISEIKEKFPKTMEPITGLQFSQLQNSNVSAQLAGMTTEQLIAALEE